MASDIEIAQKAKVDKITTIASKINISDVCKLITKVMGILEARSLSSTSRNGSKEGLPLHLFGTYQDSDTTLF